MKTAGSEITAHETLHASLWAYRVKSGKANFGEECSDKEESLCYIFGQFYRDLVAKMYKFKYWSN